MRLPVWYDGQNVDIMLPDRVQTQVFDLPARRLRAIEANHWLNRGPVPEVLAQVLAEANRLLVVVNDIYRPTPTARILAALQDLIQVERAQFLIATGLHPEASASDLQTIFGSFLPAIARRVQSHRAQADEDLAEFGSGEVACRLNKLFTWCDSILTIGSVEPHYFAGFTGGRKIILPGCASFGDVERNHAWAVSESSQPLKTQGNLVWEDIQKRTTVLDNISRASIQVVCDHGKQIYFASCGDWDLSYEQACDFVVANYAHAVEELFDVVISIVYPPLDRNLYQLQKSYENLAAAVREGGTILLLSGCADGVGDERFLKLAEALAEGKRANSGHGEDAVMGIHKVRRTNALANRVKLVLCSKLAPETLGALPIAARSEVQSAIDEVINQYGNQCRVAVVLDAASQVLYRRAA